MARPPLPLPDLGLGRLSGGVKTSSAGMEKQLVKMEMLPAVPGWHENHRPLIPESFANTFPEYRRG